MSVKQNRWLCVIASVGFAFTRITAAQDCGLAQPAFCETFETGPAPLNERGRGGELSRSKFSVTRYAPSLSTGDGVRFWAWEAELGLIPEEIDRCRSDATGLLPITRDTLICDPALSIGTHYLLTAVSSQNYGVNAYRIRQPFDFANRTGTITFDADITENFLLGYSSLVISDDPAAAPSWDINGRGPNPRNGVVVVFFHTPMFFGVRDYAMSSLSEQGEPLTMQRGHLTRVEVRVSQQQIELLSSAPSVDGIHFSPLLSRRVVSFAQPLPFTRGYVSLLAHNHATWKYGISFGALARPLRSWNTYWDNIGFDGPIIGNTREYEIPGEAVPATRTTVDEYPAGVFHTELHQGLSSAYLIPDGAGQMSSPLSFHDVSLLGATRARLVFNGYYQGYDIDGIRLGTGRLRYRINNFAVHERAFTPGEVAMLDSPGQTGGYNHAIDLPLSELVPGENSVQFSTLNISSGYPNAVLNLDLLIDFDLGRIFASSFEAK